MNGKDTYLDMELSTPVVDQHLVDTIKRLQCLKQPLEDPVSFQLAARELLEWCSDPRAFTPTFEPYLMECLQVIRKYSDYEVELSYRVLALCASNGDKLSDQSSVILTQWSEELGKTLLLRHKSRNLETCEESLFFDRETDQQDLVSMHPGMQQHMLRKQYSGDVGQMRWPEAGGGSGNMPGARGPPGQPGLSVVATVYGMTPGTPMMSGGYDSMAMYSRGGAPAGQLRPGTPGYPQQGGPPPPFYRQNSMPSAGVPGGVAAPAYGAQYPGPTTGNPDYQPPPEALSAAAMVAAAATATATATATASMMVQPDHPHYHQQVSNSSVQPHPHMSAQYNPAYHGSPHGVRMMMPRDMPPNQMHSAPGGPMPSSYAPRRSAPYPSPQMMVQRKQHYPTGPQSSMTYGGMTPHPSHPYPPQMHPQQSHLQSSRGIPQQPVGMAMAMSGNSPPRAPPPYSGAPPGYMNRGGMPHQPATSPPCQPPYQNGYMTPTNNMQDIKPATQPTGGDLLLTFPTRDGTILPPFKLEHNLTISDHTFFLKDSVFHLLMERADLELQLKCFHYEDRQQNPNWPASVSISVNSRQLLIDRGDRTYHKPLYLKSVCVPGKNNITITVRACCCSHLFFLQVVHRPTVKSVLYAILKKNLLPGPKCIEKIKRNFASINGMGSIDTDGVEQTSVKVTLKCPITFRRIMLPARGSECSHIQCFDLESYLQLNSERGSWRCPVCSKNAALEGLEIDQYMWGIVDQLCKTEVDEINIDAKAAWKPNSPVVTKEEDSKADVCGTKNTWNVYSPSSTNLPSANSYEGPQHNPTSPYPTPPNSHNSQGSSIAHYNGGIYDVGFNSPPDFSGPMSNRSDASETDKQRMNMLHRQQSGINSPQGGLANSNNPYSVPGGPGSNIPASSNQSMVQGPPSNAPLSHGGPPSNAPPSNHSVTAANNSADLSADLSDFVNNDSSGDPLDLDQELLAYFGPQSTSNGNKTENSMNSQNPDYDDILSLLEES